MIKPLLLALILIEWLVLCLYDAPEGYEDSDGFHFHRQ